MVACDIYFDTGLTIKEQLKLFGPLLRSWIGDDFENYYYAELNFFSYHPNDGGFLISISINSSFHKSDYDNDRFRYKIGYIDEETVFSDEENIKRLSAMLELLWSNNIPTCTPGCGESLPNNGGEDGPIPWPAA